MSVLSFLEEVKRAAYQRGLDDAWTEANACGGIVKSRDPESAGHAQGVDDVLDALEKKGARDRCRFPLIEPSKAEGARLIEAVTLP